MGKSFLELNRMPGQEREERDIPALSVTNRRVQMIGVGCGEMPCNQGLMKSDPWVKCYVEHILCSYVQLTD